MKESKAILQKRKIQFGWNKILEDSFKSITKQNGVFLIKKTTKKNKKSQVVGEYFYWYWKFSSIYNPLNKREIFLCKAEEDSFQKAVDIVYEKLQKGSVGKRNKTNLSTYIQEYFKVLDEEVERDIYKRSHKTIERMKKGVSDFGKFATDNKIKLSILTTENLLSVMKDYTIELKTREQKNNPRKNLAHSTIKIYLSDVRRYFDFLTSSNDYEFSGKNLFKEHRFTYKVQKVIFKEICGDEKKSVQPRFEEDYYKSLYTDCKDKVRYIWTYYIEHGRVIPVGYFTKNGAYKENKPSYFIGNDIVYFCSLIQLSIGCRISEILYAHRSREAFHESRKRNNIRANEMGSFFEKTSKGYELHIFNSKGKSRVIPIRDTIWNWNTRPPISSDKYTFVEGHKDIEERYETNIVEVILELFKPHDSYYAFPTTFVNTKKVKPRELKNSPRSLNHFMNTFKKLAVLHNWTDIGVKTSHDLRKLFISFMVSKKIPMQDVALITGQSISTIQKYYLRESVDEKRDTFDLIPENSLHRRK